MRGARTPPRGEVSRKDLLKLDPSGLPEPSVGKTPLPTYPLAVIQQLAPKPPLKLRHPVELQGTNPKDRILFVVNATRPYFPDPSYLQAIATRLVARHCLKNRIPGLSKETFQHEIASATFLVGGHLRRWTLFIKKLPDILRFVEMIKQKLINRDPGWELHVEQTLVKNKLNTIRPAVVIAAIKSVQAEMLKFENQIQLKIDNEDGSWEEEIKQKIKLRDEVSFPKLENAVLALRNRVIVTIRDGRGSWQRIYEKGMYELLCSDDAGLMFQENKDWVKIYRDGIFELCSENARSEGAEWIEKYRKVVTGKNSDYPLLHDKAFDLGVLYKKGQNAQDELDVVRWEEKTTTPEFEVKLAQVREAYRMNKAGFKILVDQIAKNYLDWLSKQRRSRFPKEEDSIYSDFYEKALAQLREYVKEESAVFLDYMGRGEYDGLTIPLMKTKQKRRFISVLRGLMSSCKLKEKNSSEVGMRPVSMVFAEDKSKKALLKLKKEQPHQEVMRQDVGDDFSKRSLLMMQSILALKDPEERKQAMALHLRVLVRMREQGEKAALRENRSPRDTGSLSQIFAKQQSGKLEGVQNGASGRALDIGTLLALNLSLVSSLQSILATQDPKLIGTYLEILYKYALLLEEAAHKKQGSVTTSPVSYVPVAASVENKEEEEHEEEVMLVDPASIKAPFSTTTLGGR